MRQNDPKSHCWARQTSRNTHAQARMVGSETTNNESSKVLARRNDMQNDGAMLNSQLQKLPDVLTVLELATLLRCSRKTVYNSIQRGEVPGVVKIGATYRINKDSIENWLTGQCYTQGGTR